MDEYLTIVATLLGAVIGGIIGFAGAYLVERQRFKKERVLEMRDKIYGPMFRETNEILEALKSFEGSYYNDLQNLKGLRNDYLFFTIGQDLKKRWFELMDRLGKYQTVRYATEINLDDAAKQYVEETFRISFTGSSGGAENNYLRLLKGKPMASALNLKCAIFLKLAPQDFIKKEKWGEGMQVDASLTGVPRAMNTLEEFETMYGAMLAKMEKDPYYLEEKEQRIHLIKELESFLGQIEPFVKSK
jgi:hypothetical protein